MLGIFLCELGNGSHADGHLISGLWACMKASKHT